MTFDRHLTHGLIPSLTAEPAVREGIRLFDVVGWNASAMHRSMLTSGLERFGGLRAGAVASDGAESACDAGFVACVSVLLMACRLAV